MRERADRLGASPNTIQTMMGHATFNMTFDQYGHLIQSATGLKEGLGNAGSA